MKRFRVKPSQVVKFPDGSAWATGGQVLECDPDCWVIERQRGKVTETSDPVTAGIAPVPERFADLVAGHKPEPEPEPEPEPAPEPDETED